MPVSRPVLPIDAALPDLLAALAGPGQAMLVAPPGAGKTTIVPLALLEAPWRGDGAILVLEPRRIAARAAAARMAALLDEPLGGIIGLRTRFETRESAATRILVVTEGVFARMIVDDPALAGIAAVLFDEFHERSLDADFGLALALETREALRPDLRLLVMSATLDDARLATLLGAAPLIRSEGRSFPIETRYRGRDPGQPIAPQMATAIRAALAVETGSILAFLPGQGEIERVAQLLAEGGLPADAELCPLYGALDPARQDAAIRPAPPGQRKIVLATAIAETSLTIEGVRIVVDSGLARVPRYEPDLGISRLETVRVSRASADQRRGRAGRTEPGIAIRLWDQAQDQGLVAFNRPEILDADLAGFRLDCAAWGAAPDALRLLDPAPAAALAEAERLLAGLGALDDAGRITARGRALRRLPLAPRLAALVLEGARRGQGETAARMAAL
ncbi:MAG: ATP-dependent helicase HrpB, partial [Rhabdaerophilum calidifontis]